MTANANGQRTRLTDALVTLTRASEWWEYKLVPTFAIFYATALMLREPVWSLWPAALALLVSLLPGAVYVSLINDLTDRADDLAAGKFNRMSSRSTLQAAALIAAPVAAGLAVGYWWRDNIPLVLAYLAAWIAFSLYSLPPFRLKARGFLGVMADASGAHLFPALVAALLVFDGGDAPPDVAWLAAVGVWALAYGLRGILWHQLSDLEADRAASVTTFAQRRGPRTAAWIARYLVFPAEAAGLAAMLWLMQHPLPLVFLLLYLVLVRRRVMWWEMKPILVEPQPRYLIFLHDYYDVFLPVGILLASALAHPADLAVIAVHFLLFPKRVREVFKETWRLRTHASAHVEVT